jgi:hypothetical protein
MKSSALDGLSLTRPGSPHWSSGSCRRECWPCSSGTSNEPVGHEGKRSHLEELPNPEPERDWRPRESDTTVAWVGSLSSSARRSRATWRKDHLDRPSPYEQHIVGAGARYMTTTQAHASPSIWNTVEEIKTNTDGLLFGASTIQLIYRTCRCHRVAVSRSDEQCGRRRHPAQQCARCISRWHHTLLPKRRYARASLNFSSPIIAPSVRSC